jgi:hypothetical protein
MTCKNLGWESFNVETRKRGKIRRFNREKNKRKVSSNLKVLREEKA